ncbi:MAG: hypothetical protein HY000_01085 [Planctomycetes bacterium]|nr:hypothetical protein [Planctomycetota bacterium]
MLLSASRPVRGDPDQAPGPQWQRGAPVAASERADFEAWTIARVAELRKLDDQDADEFDPAVVAVRTELEQATVDWGTYLVKTVDSFKFPQMAIVNHSWFQWKQRLDLKRDLRSITGQVKEADNVLPDGTVPHSAFFTRTDISSYTPERLRSEFAELTPVGKITITKEKKSGTSEGFFGKDERGVEYIFVFDPPFNPEMQTTADHVGSTLTRLMGWRVPKTVVCTVTGTGKPEYDGRRAVASVAVKKIKGGWTYRSFRDRREVRALLVVGAWLNNVDQSEHNTATTEPAPGVYTYYNWDYGAALGSFTFRPKWPRLGWQHLWAPVSKPLAEITGPPWETHYRVHSAAVGYFTPNFDPDRWTPFYPNLGFSDVTLADRRWAAERIAQISDQQIRTIVESAKFTYASDAEYVIATLIARRDCVAGRYLRQAATNEKSVVSCQ